MNDTINYKECWKLLRKSLQKHIEDGTSSYEDVSYAMLRIMDNIEKKCKGII